LLFIITVFLPGFAFVGLFPSSVFPLTAKSKLAAFYLAPTTLLSNAGIFLVVNTAIDPFECIILIPNPSDWQKSRTDLNFPTLPSDFFSIAWQPRLLTVSVPLPWHLKMFGRRSS